MNDNTKVQLPVVGSERHEGDGVAILFDGARCIHSRNCVLSRPDVFVPHVEGEWIHPERATVAEVVALAEGCPSGAIRYVRLDGGPEETAPRVNVVRVRENGPYAFSADMRWQSGGTEERERRATLCRCGQSANKPYCDGSHVGAAFVASGEPAAKESPAPRRRDGPLTVAATPNGPLRVTGNLEICSGTGRTLARVDEAFLCRCGHSQNKPYCDGSHARVGFRAP